MDWYMKKARSSFFFKSDSLKLWLYLLWAYDRTQINSWFNCPYNCNLEMFNFHKVIWIISIYCLIFINKICVINVTSDMLLRENYSQKSTFWILWASKSRDVINHQWRIVLPDPSPDTSEAFQWSMDPQVDQTGSDNPD